MENIFKSIVFILFVGALAAASSCASRAPKFGSGLAKVPASPKTSSFEKQMHARLNRDRAKYGLQPLKWDAKLADIARFHSRDMKQNSFFGHNSPTTGSLDDRVVMAGYLALVARENVAIAPDVETGQDGLLASRGHFENIMSRDVTRVGIGIVPGSSSDPRDLTITQVFAKPASSQSPSQASSQIEQAIQKARRKSGLTALGKDQRLTALARKHIRDLPGDFSGKDARKVGDAVERKYSKGAPKNASAVVAVAAQFLDAEEFLVPSIVTSRQTIRYGLAVGRVKDEQGRPALTLLLLLVIR